MMSDMMDFPKTVEEFMEMYKMVDTDEVYSNGTEYVPIFRMKQWFEHVGNSERLDRTCAKCKHYTKEQLCVWWSYFGFKPEDYCSRWEERDD